MPRITRDDEVIENAEAETNARHPGVVYKPTIPLHSVYPSLTRANEPLRCRTAGWLGEIARVQPLVRTPVVKTLQQGLPAFQDPLKQPPRPLPAKCGRIAKLGRATG